MKRKMLTIILMIFVSSALYSAEINWSPLREIVDGLRSVNETIDSVLQSVSEGGMQPGATAEIPAGINSTAQYLKIKFTQPDAEYKYLLEIWGIKDGEYQKGIEFYFDDENRGQFIIRSNVFNSILFPDEGHYVKAVYNHSSSARTMTVDVMQTAAGKPAKAKYLVSQQDGIISLYFTAHMHDVDINANSTKDAYLFGARIMDTDPFTCIAKYGLADIGGAYDFMLFGAGNADNAGLFDSESGFIDDGVASAGAGYPDPAEIVAAGLPISEVVDNIIIEFEEGLSPDF